MRKTEEKKDVFSLYILYIKSSLSLFDNANYFSNFFVFFKWFIILYIKVLKCCRQYFGVRKVVASFLPKFLFLFF